MTKLTDNRRYLDALQDRVLVFDGAMGTNLQRQNLTPAQFGGERTFGCNDYLVLTYPTAVEIVHRSFPGSRRGRAGNLHLPRQPPDAGRIRPG